MPSPPPVAPASLGQERQMRADVPQANRLSLLVRLLLAMEEGDGAAEALSLSLGVEVRTVHYYLELGRWVGLVRGEAEGGKWSLSEAGHSFAQLPNMRARLFRTGMLAQPLVQAVEGLMRAEAERFSGERAVAQACEEVIGTRTRLTGSTVARRAQALAALLDPAWNPQRYDWTTGEPHNPGGGLLGDFPGPSFVSAMAARRYHSGRPMQIALVRQVMALAGPSALATPAPSMDLGQARHPGFWPRASYEAGEGLWFGSLPVTPQTLRASQAGGAALREWLVTCSPHVALLVALLLDPRGGARPWMQMSRDMYGLRIWAGEVSLGGPLELVEAFARHLGLEPGSAAPASHPATGACAELLSQASEADLVTAGLGAGLWRERRTRLELPAGLAAEFARAHGELPSLLERLAPLLAQASAFVRGRLGKQG